MNIRIGNTVQLKEAFLGEIKKFSPGTTFIVKYIFPEAQLIAGCEIGQTQLNIIPYDKLKLVEKPKINSKVNYLISPGEPHGNREKGVVTGTLKAYDSVRNIGLMYFGGSKSKGTCGCYIMVKKMPDNPVSVLMFKQYSDETWVNIEE